MRRLVWALAWTAVAVWSLLAWGAYGLLDLVGGLAAGGAVSIALDPGVGSVVTWTVNALKGLGLFAIVAVWGFVSLVILAFGWLMARVAGGPARLDVTYYRGDNPTYHPPQGYPPHYPPGPRPMRDVTPPRHDDRRT